MRIWITIPDDDGQRTVKVTQEGGVTVEKATLDDNARMDVEIAAEQRHGDDDGVSIAKPLLVGFKTSTSVNPRPW